MYVASSFSFVLRGVYRNTSRTQVLAMRFSLAHDVQTASQTHVQTIANGHANTARNSSPGSERARGGEATR